MSSGTDGTYEASPAALRRAITSMEALPEIAERIRQRFIRRERDFTEWPGWTDDFAYQARPGYEENNQYCMEVADGLREALKGLVDATHANLKEIEDTQQSSTERIESFRRKTETGPGGVPGSSTTGKH
ncbi:hypothetical protein [Streptomyces sp. AK02-01A]|uniref:hypothetical protein n=1 Tax=Streptomyces sp. AK02-01A TaxID=3028648 RepID=UPI0029B9B39D|nr:hypothetical protein [Streptomyces sp. AK02-01A]MDX3853055.1 hypothetical protein [Streptomyces sp. AK02-01A]